MDRFKSVKENGAKNGEQWPKLKIKLQYKSDLTENLILRISENLKTILFANGSESFILEEINGKYYQRNLLKVPRRIIRYVEEDSSSSGAFFVLYSKEYDSHLHIMHTRKPDLNFKFKRYTEPRTLTIFDVRMGLCSSSSQPPETDESVPRNQIVFTGVKDNQFIFDIATFEEITTKGTFAKENVQVHNVEITQNQQSQIAAFSFTWPYITFSGPGQSLFIVNAYDPERYNCIEPSTDCISNGLVIRAMHVTDTYHLFALMFQNKKYYLYRFDLDFCNSFTSNPVDKKSCINMSEHLVAYEPSFVGYRNFKKMHVKSSHKLERLNMEQEMIVLLLHEDYLYSWSSRSLDGQRFNTLKFVIKLHNPNFVVKNDSSIFF